MADAEHVVVWLRQDLRIADNTALHHACRDPGTRVSALFCLTPGQAREHDVAPVRNDFELRQLHCLRTDLMALNIPLTVLIAERYSELPALIVGWMRQHGASALHANRQYEVNELARDQTVTAALAQAGMTCHWQEDLCILPPGSVLTGEGRPYTVFTPFQRNWLARLAAAPPRLLPAPMPRQCAATTGTDIPAIDQNALPGGAMTVDTTLANHLWPAGEAAAHARLAAFLTEDGDRYDSQRDLPAINGTSTLSPWLAAGVLSPRQCLIAAWQRQRQLGGSIRALDVWIGELCWRDFYKHILAAFPHVCRGHAFRRETDAIAWRHDQALFQAWCEGRTGFPIVDAAMRQLAETGWMHNRLRMITAMFLSKDLFIDWRWGERHFMRHLIDGDFSANNGGWQWCASTGNDAAPYFRVFNPWLQGKRCDPQGEFIRRFVPELVDAPTRALHDPQALRPAGYPRPIVDHAEAREHAVASFRALDEARRRV